MSDTPNPPAPDPSGPPPAPAPPGPAPGIPYAGRTMPTHPDPADVEKNKVLAMLSYLGLLWLVPLLAAKDSPYARFHCNQGILLSIIGFCGWGIVTVGAMIPFVNICAGCVVMPLFMVVMLTLIVWGVVNALTGRMKTLPFFPAITWVK